MHFKSSMRINPTSREVSGYYCLRESYRDARGDVRSRTILTVGFLEDLSTEELHLIQMRLTEKVRGIQGTLFSSLDSEKVRHYVDKFYSQMVGENKIDIAVKGSDFEKFVDSDTINNKEVREVGSEW